MPRRRHRPHREEPLPGEGGGTDRVIDRRIPNVDQVAALTLSTPEPFRAAVTLAAWGTLRRGEVLGLNRQDIDLRAGAILVERSFMNSTTAGSSSVPRRTATPVRAICRVRLCRRSRTTCAVSSAPRATLLSSRRNGAAAAAQQLLGHLGDRTAASRTHVGALPRSAPPQCSPLPAQAPRRS